MPSERVRIVTCLEQGLYGVGRRILASLLDQGRQSRVVRSGREALRLERLISPGGLEELFRQFGNAGLPDPDTLAEMAARYGTELNFENTTPILERHGLRF